MRIGAACAVVAGIFFTMLALCARGALPSVVPASGAPEVSRAIRIDHGDVLWVRYPMADYTPLERLGRQVYLREGCWYCHSQHVQPVTHETQRWGPPSEIGEYAWDRPHLSATPRIGPDLSRIGLKYSDDWHYAHHWDPRLTVPRSIMPRSPWLYEQVAVPVERGPGGPRLVRTPESARYFTFRKDRPLVLFPDATGLIFVLPRADGEWPVDGTPVLDLTPLAGQPLPLVVRLLIPTRDLVALVRYLQRLGTDRGLWRDVFAPYNVTVAAMTIPDTAELRDRGAVVYQQRCVGCHGVRGDGNGPAATFLLPRPRDFTAAVFKFRTTPSGSLPTDGDLYQTVTRGVRGTAMPTGHELSHTDRVAVIAYIKMFSTRWRDETPDPAPQLGTPPPATPELVGRGREVYHRAKCWECHGTRGRGDGPAAAQLRDDFDLPSRPTDFARDQFKSGASATDVFRALTLGLDGTPMPSFADVVDETDRWALAYYVLSLSAWMDPLTGERLPLPSDGRLPLVSAGLQPFDSGAAGTGARTDHVAGAGGRPRPYSLVRGGHDITLASLTLGELVVAGLMGCAALSLLLWGRMAGALAHVETAKHRVLEVESELD